MKRRQVVVTVIKRVEDEFIEQIVTGFHGGGKPHKVVKRVETGRYRSIGYLTSEAVDDGAEQPTCDKVYISPEDFTFHYLKRVS